MIQSRWIRRVVAAAAVLCLASGLVHASDAGVEKTAEPKHEGMHVRMTVGTGFSHFSTSFPDHDFTLMGATIIPELHLGFSAIENLIISGGLSGAFLVEPSLDGDILGESYSASSGLTAVNAGMGLTYFFMPYHIFLGVQANISYASFKMDQESIGEASYQGISKHRLGFATGLQFGKQWWVTQKSSLGLGLNYMFYLYPRSFSGKQEEQLGTDSVIWLGHTVGLGMTATFN